jgi:hypothetical protein
MTKLFYTFMIAAILMSCKQETTDLKAAAPETVMTPTSQTPAKEGYGKVTLKCGAQTLTVDGKCGGITNTGEMIIAVQDKTTPAKVFTISFNTKDYPQNGKIYTIKKSDFMSEDKKPDGDIYVAFTEMTQKAQMDWSSDDQTGTMTFQINGNEIKCTFKDLKLQPSEVYNKADLNQVATASGEITLYKN